MLFNITIFQDSPCSLHDLSGLRSVLDELRASTHDFEAAWAKIARAAKGDEDSRVPEGAVLSEANPCVIVTGDQVRRICLFNIAICLLALVKQISEDTSIKKKAEKKYLDVLD